MTTITNSSAAPARIETAPGTFAAAYTLIWSVLVVYYAAAVLVDTHFGELTWPALVMFAEAFAKLLVSIFGAVAGVFLLRARSGSPLAAAFAIDAGAAVFAASALATLIVSIVTGQGLALSYLDMQPWYVVLPLGGLCAAAAWTVRRRPALLAGRIHIPR